MPAGKSRRTFASLHLTLDRKPRWILKSLVPLRAKGYLTRAEETRFRKIRPPRLPHLVTAARAALVAPDCAGREAVPNLSFDFLYA